ncbi:uncharacterized protein BCR38DRAFT_479737 [Pseudomassariella vexata]|uniref:Uncharacterized protein n=1 Tax=Pseudomassariella vexata TaxID=1141098 RepID=A0A1Y2EI19_9PEZI|nr:uncharacterized protein BCR38DRAFT_479737 [Pseudomassariella vexata]ORY71219.1 hypothetical protein BCR38DRAFT_479737 [Pseudomassariella vexata]
MSGYHDVGSGSLNAAVDWSRNSSFGVTSTGFAQAASADNSTYMVINQFKFLAARSIRTSTIVLATFNTISAAATAAGIYYDCYSTAKRNCPVGKKVNKLTCVKGPETFPFVLSLGITIQGIIFAVSQSRGLEGLFERGCSIISQFMWTAIFIVPYIQLIFGLEVALRGLRSKPFPQRSKWTVAICLAGLKIVLMITGLVAFFIRAPDFCFASLFFFVARWAEGGFVLLLVIAVLLTICAVTIFIKLTRNADIETSERVLASRMVYYLALAIISTLLMIPFFGFLTFNDIVETGKTTSLTLAMIATVVANVSGLMTGGLHLFLRSNTISTIGPRDKLAEYERQKLKYNIRMQSPNDLDEPAHMMQTVNNRSLRRKDSEETLVRYEKEEEAAIESPSSTYYNIPRFESKSPNPLRSNAVTSPIAIPRNPDRAQLSSASSHTRKASASYSLFPSKDNASTNSVAFLPSTTYSPNSNMNEFTFNLDDIKPPPSIKVNGRHKRDSSMSSTATVQIGLRLSNVQDMPRTTSTIINNDDRVHNLGCPNLAPIRPNPLFKLGVADQPTSPSENISHSNCCSCTEEPSRDVRMKTLPPVPHAIKTVQSQASTGEETLSPAVYSPHSPQKAKLPSPKGVGFNVLKRANTTPVQPDGTPPPPRNRGNSDAQRFRSDWI